MRKWHRDSILKSTKEFKTFSEWVRKESSAYLASKKLGISDEVKELFPVFKIKYTKKQCLKIGNKFTIRSHWQLQEPNSYAQAKRNNWLEECCSHMVVKRKQWNEELCLAEARRYHTRRKWKEASNASYLWAIRHGCYNKCVDHMKNFIKVRKWTLNLCKEETKKFKTITEWQEKSSGSYSSAIDNGWVKQCSTHMEVLREKFTKEQCLKISSKYKSREEWKNSHSRSYHYAHSHGWWIDCTRHMKKKGSLEAKWNEKSIKQEAKTFSTRTQWIRENPSSYNAAKRLGVVDKCSRHMKKVVRYSPKFAINMARKYKKKSAFQKAHPSIYSYIQRKGLLDKAFFHIKVLNNHWTKEKCKKVSKKYKTKTSWQKSKDRHSYYFAFRRGWMDDCSKHMRGLKIRWTESIVREKTKNFKSISEWQNLCPNSYAWASRNKIINNFTQNMISLKREPWTSDQIRIEALKHNSRGEFVKNSNGAANAAYNLGIMKQVCSHMTKTKVIQHEKIFEKQFDDFLIELGFKEDVSKRLKNNFLFCEQKILSKDSRIDRVIKITKSFGVELKSDNSPANSKKRTERQTKRYRKLANLKQYRYNKVFSVSETGSCADMSFEQFKEWIKEQVQSSY